MTSNAPASNGVTTALLSQNIIATSNKIPFYEKGAMKRRIGRRLVIYDMRKYLGRETPVPDSAFTNKGMLKFVSLCPAVTEAYKHPLTSLKTALYTSLYKNVNKITAGLIYDPASLPEVSLTATTVMALRRNTTCEQMCSAFEAMSPILVDKTNAGLIQPQKHPAEHAQSRKLGPTQTTAGQDDHDGQLILALLREHPDETVEEHGHPEQPGG